MVNTLICQLSTIKSRRDVILCYQYVFETFFIPSKETCCYFGDDCFNQTYIWSILKIILFSLIHKKANWNSLVLLNDLAKNELKLRLKIFDRFNNKPI